MSAEYGIVVLNLQVAALSECGQEKRPSVAARIAKVQRSAERIDETLANTRIGVIRQLKKRVPVGNDDRLQTVRCGFQYCAQRLAKAQSRRFSQSCALPIDHDEKQKGEQDNADNGRIARSRTEEQPPKQNAEADYRPNDVALRKSMRGELSHCDDERGHEGQGSNCHPFIRMKTMLRL